MQGLRDFISGILLPKGSGATREIYLRGAVFVFSSPVPRTCVRVFTMLLCRARTVRTMTIQRRPTAF